MHPPPELVATSCSSKGSRKVVTEKAEGEEEAAEHVVCNAQVEDVHRVWAHIDNAATHEREKGVKVGVSTVSSAPLVWVPPDGPIICDTMLTHVPAHTKQNRQSSAMRRWARGPTTVPWGDFAWCNTRRRRPGFYVWWQ